MISLHGSAAPKDCSPPKGTQCHEYNSGHSHKGLDPHYHVWQMNQIPSTGICHWNKKRAAADTYSTAPSGMKACSTYSTWKNND
jgi:hypothetical protein